MDRTKKKEKKDAQKKVSWCLHKHKTERCLFAWDELFGAYWTGRLSLLAYQLEAGGLFRRDALRTPGLKLLAQHHAGNVSETGIGGGQISEKSEGGEKF